MKKAFLFLALCLLGAGRAAAAEPADSVRNVIYMIGDGMGLAHVSMLAVEGGYAPTAFDRAQGIALISTYSANNRVTDSAAAGTALACGSKTNNGTLGLDPRGGRLQSLIEWAVAEGMPAGIAVKCHLQHATPAAFYAHVPDRGDEKAITRDLLASNIDVLRCRQAARKGVPRGRFVSRCVRPPRLCGRRFARRGGTGSCGTVAVCRDR